MLECAGDLCKCRKSFESWRGLAQAEIEHDGDAGDTLAASTVERESEGLRAMHLTPEGGHAIASGERVIDPLERAAFDFGRTHAARDFNR